MYNEANNRKLDFIRVANYYYKSGLTQEQISKKMNMSRQRVNRILSKCIEEGIVTITIEGEEGTYLDLEQTLEKKFNLKAVRISEKVTEKNVYREIGSIASAYLSSIMKSNDIIGFSRGRSTAALVDSFHPLKKSSDITVTQLMGSWNNQNSKVSVDDIVYKFSEKTGAMISRLHAPVVANNPDFRKVIISEPFFRDAYDIVKSCTIAVIGIGDVKNEVLLPTIGKDVYEAYIQKEAVGEICTHFFNIDGEIIKTPFRERVISIEMEDFINIPTRIGIAGSECKLRPIIGALRGGYVTALVTDFDTAESLLNLDF